MMMLTEGIGIHAPKKWQVVLTSADLSAIVAECRRRNGLRQYQNRIDQWGRGLSDAIVIANCTSLARHEVPIVVGFVGEYACKVLINRRMKRHVCDLDLRLLQAGDCGSDLKPCGLGIQIKCRQRDYGCSLLKEGPIRFSALLACEWVPGSLVCSVLGWQWAKHIEELPLVSARRGTHRNRELPDTSLLPFSSLIDELKVRAAWR